MSRRVFSPLIVSFAASLTVPHPQASADALDDALALAGLLRRDLGWTPKGWWPRWPTAEYKLRAFDALFAEPLDTVGYTRDLARFAFEKLDPAGLDRDNGRGGRPLFEAVQRLGIDPKFGGFRGYTANLIAPEAPLEDAILKIYEISGRDTRGYTFGMELPYPRVADRLREAVKVLPEGVSPILGQLVLNIIEARRWVDLAFRNVDPRARQVAASRFNLGEEMIDAVDYCPEVDDVGRTWDEASMWYAAQKCVDALDLARIRLSSLPLKALGDFTFDWETPWGWIRLRGAESSDPVRPVGMMPRASDAVDAKNTLLIVDLGGDRQYVGPVAAASIACPLSLLLDLIGDDTYGPRGQMHDGARGSPCGPAQGAGLCGIGVLLDACGDDTYRAGHYAQGVGQFGFGLLADLNGNDTYEATVSAQGCGYFGSGLLLDLFGNDEYYIHADGQGFGGVAGVGVLFDRSGNDQYTAERKHSITGRPSYHSPNLDVGVSNAQGCGMGRRGDGSDGHSWAGGLGALLDGGGDDVYTAGNWSMGTGYWFGIGLLHDGGGDDQYHGVAWSQGAGAHFCIGALIDEGGDDQHLAEENSHLSLAMAHDFTIGILLDAAGDDLYQVNGSGLAYSINRSIALLIDTAGRDTYQTDVPRRTQENTGLRPGYAWNPENFRNRGIAAYFADTTSLGLFLDIGGEDRYWNPVIPPAEPPTNPAAPATQPAATPPAPIPIGNNRHWLDPPDSPNWPDRNFSVGVDRPDGSVDFVPAPIRAPSLADRRRVAEGAAGRTDDLKK